MPSAQTLDRMPEKIGTQMPGPGAEVVPEQEGERGDGDDEDLADLRHVPLHRGVQPREAGDVDGVVVVLDLLLRAPSCGRRGSGSRAPPPRTRRARARPCRPRAT